MGCATRIRNRTELLDGMFPYRKSSDWALGEYSTTMVKNKTVYATTQPPEPPPPASMGVDGVVSCSGPLEVRVKSEVKESIVVYVVRELRDAVKLSEADRLLHAHLLYNVGLN